MFPPNPPNKQRANYYSSAPAHINDDASALRGLLRAGPFASRSCGGLLGTFPSIASCCGWYVRPDRHPHLPHLPHPSDRFGTAVLTVSKLCVCVRAAAVQQVHAGSCLGLAAGRPGGRCWRRPGLTPLEAPAQAPCACRRVAGGAGGSHLDSEDWPCVFLCRFGVPLFCLQ